MMGDELGRGPVRSLHKARVRQAGPRLCARWVPPHLSDFLLGKHRKEGVDVRLSMTVTSIGAGRERALAMQLSGVAQEFDAVVVGIGLVLNTDLAEACGLEVRNGIVVDPSGRSSDPDIYAVGDVANQHNSWAEGRLRFESWANAQNQAIAVGKAIAGGEVVYDEIPWFWSDQYGLNLQVLGIPSNDLAGIVRGSVDSTFQRRRGGPAREGARGRVHDRVHVFFRTPGKAVQLLAGAGVDALAQVACGRPGSAPVVTALHRQHLSNPVTEIGVGTQVNTCGAEALLKITHGPGRVNGSWSGSSRRCSPAGPRHPKRRLRPAARR
ncbi:MAG: FAD-dependent oxidoreductase [Burkholderiaceae bacterium]